MASLVDTVVDVPMDCHMTLIGGLAAYLSWNEFLFAFSQDPAIDAQAGRCADTRGLPTLTTRHQKYRDRKPRALVIRPQTDPGRRQKRLIPGTPSALLEGARHISPVRCSCSW